jgi:hypothetical protein
MFLWLLLLPAHARTLRIPQPPLLIGLFPLSAPEASRSPQLWSAAQALGFSFAGLPSPPTPIVLEVPAPQALSQLLSDDRFSVSARAALLAGERRSHSDLGTPAAAALALAHLAAWERLASAPAAPAAIIVVDPGSVDGAAPRPPEALARAADAMWGNAPPADLLLLGALVPPRAAASRAPAGGELGASGWRVPQQWRGWHAYIVTRAGAAALLAQGAAPVSQRPEAHASALVNLGLLSAAWLPDAPPAPARVAGWASGGAGASALGALLEEVRCDLCDVPEDYSRFGHIGAVGMPVAVLAGLLSGWLAYRYLLPRRAAASTTASVCRVPPPKNSS